MPVTCFCFQFAITAWFFSSCYVLFSNRHPLFELANTCDNAGCGFDFFCCFVFKYLACLKSQLLFSQNSQSVMLNIANFISYFSANLSFANCRNACRKKSKNLMLQITFCLYSKYFSVLKYYRLFFACLMKYQIFSQVCKFTFFTELFILNCSITLVLKQLKHFIT